MPNAKVLSEKQAIVEALAERIKGASAGILVDYKGITVSEDTALRTELRKDEVNYTVVKNTLTRKALDKLGMSGLDHVLNGTTSLATAENDHSSLLSVSSMITARSWATVSTSRLPSWRAEISYRR